MTPFTDNDGERLKEWLDGPAGEAYQFRDKYGDLLKALLARLEASEAIHQKGWTIEREKTWRKACGRDK